MVEDLKNWLAYEPVRAYPDPWTVTARRWIGKNRTLVTGWRGSGARRSDQSRYGHHPSRTEER